MQSSHSKNLKILIATPLYPPEIGGPSNYAKSLEEEFSKMGHEVRVRTFGKVSFLPTGLRHIAYFFYILPGILRADFTVALDTYSAAFPTVFAGWLFRRKVVIRTGGDFLWETYVERTGESILLSDFYKEKRAYTLKERVIFAVTKWTLHHTTHLVFSTKYQRDIWLPAYNLDRSKISLIENYYGDKAESSEAKTKNFICFTRDLKWKNLDLLKSAFAEAKITRPEIELETGQVDRGELMEKLKTCYAVILVSLGDISPNFILEALSYNRPVILTGEHGLEQVRDIVLEVDPLDKEAITDAIISMSVDSVHQDFVNKVTNFNYTHTYQQIAEEFMGVYKGL